MAGMYEKLGDLLNETLEAGHVKFIHIEREEAEQDEASSGAGREAGGQAGGAQSSEGQPDGNDAGSQFSECQPDGRKSDGDFARTFYRAEAEAERRYFKTSWNDGEHRTTGNFGSSGGGYRRITPELERAFALLGLESTADKEAVKKAYKEKLLYYHPDRYAGKDVMEKVANDKTREVVAAYRLIMETIA